MVFFRIYCDARQLLGALLYVGLVNSIVIASEILMNCAIFGNEVAHM